jgi:Deacetylase PdaC
MRLTISGSKVTGTYFYDHFKQDIPLEGTYDAKGQLELVEGSGKHKTGKFICKKESQASDVDLECEWSRPDGTGKALVFLNEQGLSFKADTRIKPKVISDRQRKVEASVPQLSAAVMTPAMNEFNRLIESRVQKAIKEFQPDSYSNAVFDTTYNLLFGDDDKVSVEINEYVDSGGAHPNTYLWTVNYDLKANKELTLDDVFRTGDDYKTAIAEFVARDINRRADEMERSEAKRNNRPPEKREEPVMTVDGLPEMNTWGFNTKGFVAYFDFPHVMAVFDKTIVPYGIVARHLKPNGVVPLVR